MSENRLSFKEMCAKFDVTPRTLRYYEYIELLAPEKDGRARWYGPREVARMTLILRGRRFGFSLEEIRQWLEIYDKRGTDAQMAEWISRTSGRCATRSPRGAEGVGPPDIRAAMAAPASLRSPPAGAASALSENGLK